MCKSFIIILQDDNDDDDDLNESAIDPDFVCTICMVREATLTCEDRKHAGRLLCIECDKKIHAHVSMMDHSRKKIDKSKPKKQSQSNAALETNENRDSDDNSSDHTPISSQTVSTKSNVVTSTNSFVVTSANTNVVTSTKAATRNSASTPQILRISASGDIIWMTSTTTVPVITESIVAPQTSSQTQPQTTFVAQMPRSSTSVANSNEIVISPMPNISLNDALTSTLESYMKANLEKMKANLSKATQPSTSKKKPGTVSALDEYVVERKGLELLMDMEIHERRKKLMDIEIYEQRESAKKRLKILAAQQAEAENKLEITRIELKAKQQKASSQNEPIAERIVFVSSDQLSTLTPNDNGAAASENNFNFSSPTAPPGTNPENQLVNPHDVNPSLGPQSEGGNSLGSLNSFPFQG